MTRGVFVTASMCALAAASWSSRAHASSAPTPIQHVIIIFQENRSFDNYFGTFPGANGIPAGVCLPLNLSNPSQGCVAPWHDPHDHSYGSNHDGSGAQNDLDDGITNTKMDGFVATQTATLADLCAKKPTLSLCTGTGSSFTWHDAAGYHDADELPNYWSYAQHFLLHDAMFPGIRSWSTPSHVDLTTEWFANCSKKGALDTCRSVSGFNDPAFPPNPAQWPWVSMFELLDMHGVSWKYYLTNGADPDCDDAEYTCEPTVKIQSPGPVWNPPKYVTYTQNQGAAYLAEHNPSSEQFWADVTNGTLPQVSWIIPNDNVSEHPWGGGTTLGMDYVTSMVNLIMQSQYWNNSVIFVVWDDWGGFYDNAVPPTIEFSDPTYNSGNAIGFVQGFGLRVPALTISPWVKAGTINHEVMSFANYNKFIEDVFMGGARLDPVAMGRPDARPSVRDALTTVNYFSGATAPIGDLMDDFDFTQTPLPALILNPHIPGNINTYCRKNAGDTTATCQKATVIITWDPLVGPQIPGPFTYHIQRDGVELPQCEGTAATCTDEPGVGNHLYRAYSVDGNGVTSPLSAAAEADEP